MVTYSLVEGLIVQIYLWQELLDINCNILEDI